MSNKTHTKPHSKKKEGEQYYFREYKHPGHNGTKIGHTDWKHRGGMYFSKNEKYLIARVLDGTIDPMPWVESWPLKPLDFEPLIWGEPREIEDDQKAIDPPSLDDIEALELQHMVLEDRTITITINNCMLKIRALSTLNEEGIDPASNKNANNSCSSTTNWFS